MCLSPLLCSRAIVCLRHRHDEILVGSQAFDARRGERSNVKTTQANRSRSAVDRRWWLKWARPARMNPFVGASSRRISVSATESEPPETATSRRVPGGQRSCRLIVRRTCWRRAVTNSNSQHPTSNSQTFRYRTLGSWELEVGSSWCRRADSNRRPRAYETRALTD